MPAKRPPPSAADSLARYNAMRNFEKTAEPAGRVAAKGGKVPRFVVQMHRATRLHYDFRLEADGVLKSWAVPKGPSLDTHDKRLAMHVEDHPLDYRDFEGIIPAKNYGAGEVVVWDRGTYRLLEGSGVTEQIAKGSVKFELRGKKLRGIFALVRIKGRDGEENAWLLIKERDDFVDPSWKIEEHPESVKSGKTLADIARDPKAPHWQSDRLATNKRAPRAPTGEPLPKDVQPMLATLVAKPFDDPQWLFELKWDGYRAIVIIERTGTLHVVSRKGNDFLSKFPELQTLPDAFTERPLIVDGEIVVLDKAGRPSFQGLQERLDRYGRRGTSKEPITLVVFDLIYGNGRDLRDEPIETRKTILESLLTGEGAVMFSKHVERDGIKLFELARDKGLEGIIGKRRGSRYLGARSRDWVKIKTGRRQEVVIGGWTEGRGSRAHFGALLAGVYEGDDLVYAGSVGTGFDQALLAAIAKKLKALERKTAPFAVPPQDVVSPHWAKPELVAEVSFSEWTRDGRMRQPVFIALREDKEPRSVVREREA